MTSGYHHGKLITRWQFELIAYADFWLSQRSEYVINGNLSLPDTTSCDKIHYMIIKTLFVQAHETLVFILLLSNELLRQDQSILCFHAQNMDVDED